MAIRTYNKDHLKDFSISLVNVAPRTSLIECDTRFWTEHITHPTLVDLDVLCKGEEKSPTKTKSWRGPFSGRPLLTNEIAPYLRQLIAQAAPNTVVQYINSLRAWWRVFDKLEAQGVDCLISVSDLNEIHRNYAFDIQMESLVFSNFLRLANLVRKSKLLPPLHWTAPDRISSIRHLPPKWQTDLIRVELKHRWFEALFRWEKCDELLSRDFDRFHDRDEAVLITNYRHLSAVMKEKETGRPSTEDIYKGMSPDIFSKHGFNIATMFAGFYPSPFDVRIAFNLCLANTGWNPAVLLSLDVTNNFLKPHPKDSSRYLMQGYKARGNSIQTTEGLFKSRGSPGMIVQKLIDRTAPLRTIAIRQRENFKHELQLLQSKGAPVDEIQAKRSEMNNADLVARSPWIYVTHSSPGIQCLKAQTYGRGLQKQSTTFLEEIVEKINHRQSIDRRIDRITPSDFRDAFAANAYTISGGMILYVMKALGHRSPTTTQIYLDNSLINGETDRLYKTFSNSLWQEIKLSGRIDPTIIAKLSRDGTITDDDRERVHQYRLLRRSRIGVGCKDPHNPPKSIAPNFISDGKRMCSTHRCTLCIDHAVIFPDSLQGLCKRLAELRFIKLNMSTLAYINSTFNDEIRNTEIALSAFDRSSVDAELERWKLKIDAGLHRVIDTDGI